MWAHQITLYFAANLLWRASAGKRRLHMQPAEQLGHTVYVCKAASSFTLTSISKALNVIYLGQHQPWVPKTGGAIILSRNTDQTADTFCAMRGSYVETMSQGFRKNLRQEFCSCP